MASIEQRVKELESRQARRLERLVMVCQKITPEEAQQVYFELCRQVEEAAAVAPIDRNRDHAAEYFAMLNR
jgi:hypothetical protein